jgi:hypothetical protein
MKQQTRRIMVREFGHYDPAWWEAHPQEWSQFWVTYRAEVDAYAELSKTPQ